MKWTIIFIALITAAISSPLRAQQVIALDSNGLIVTLKERYGSYTLDTYVAVSLVAGQYVLVKKDERSGWFPASFHSVRVIRKLSDKWERVVLDE